MSSSPLTAPARALARLWTRSRALTLWGAVLIVLLLAVLIGPLFLVSPEAQNLAVRLNGPSPAHWLGTDDFGRDILSRVITGGQLSFAIGAAVTAAALALGSAVGFAAGFYQRSAGWIMRVMDALQSFPQVILGIALAVGLSTRLPGALGLIIALTAAYTPLLARVIRSRTLVLAETGYVRAARVAGVRGFRILATHIAPNALPAIVVQASFIFASTLLSEASLGFLGIGINPPTPTWGNMIADGQQSMDTAPWIIIAPGLAIVISVIVLTMTGDALRAIADPRAKAILDLQRLRRRRQHHPPATPAPPPPAPPLTTATSTTSHR